jgi:hypothetical protein
MKADMALRQGDDVSHDILVCASSMNIPLRSVGVLLHLRLLLLLGLFTFVTVFLLGGLGLLLGSGFSGHL